MRIAAAGGQPKDVVQVDLAKGERQYMYPCALPGGKAILLTVGTADSETFDDARIVVLIPRPAREKRLWKVGLTRAIRPPATSCTREAEICLPFASIRGGSRSPGNLSMFSRAC